MKETKGRQPTMKKLIGAVIGVLVILAGIGIAGGGGEETAEAVPTTEAPATTVEESTTTTTEATTTTTQPTTTTTEPYEIDISDVSVELIVLESQCFNTAGALVVVEPDLRVEPRAMEALSSGTPYTIIYDVTGIEGGTDTYRIETHGDGTYSYNEHRLSTATCDYNLKAEVTAVIAR